MTETDPANVPAAFEMLLEEIEAEIGFVNEVGAEVFKKGDYNGARKALDRAGQIAAFRDKVVLLRKEWEELSVVHYAEEEAVRGGLAQGSSTPQEAYYQPILKTLNQLGGAAKVSDVLTQVEQIMKGLLKDADYELIPSGKMRRWCKNANWARYEMVKDGLLKSDSQRGIWEISEAGQKALAKGSP